MHALPCIVHGSVYDNVHVYIHCTYVYKHLCIHLCTLDHFHPCRKRFMEHCAVPDFSITDVVAPGEMCTVYVVCTCTCICCYTVHVYICRYYMSIYMHTFDPPTELTQ